MSQSSFPRPEHIAALVTHIEKSGRQARMSLQASSAGLDRYHCKYRIRLEFPNSGRAEEIAVHFQVAEKLLAEGRSKALDALVGEVIHRGQSAAVNHVSRDGN